MKSEFAYVPYDEKACQEQNVLRLQCEAIRTEILDAVSTTGDSHPLLTQFEIQVSQSDESDKYKNEAMLTIQQIKVAVDAGNKTEAILRLEEAYFWAGKMVRLSKIARSEAPK